MTGSHKGKLEVHHGSVGYGQEFGFYLVCRGKPVNVSRVVSELNTKLEQEGYEIIPWSRTQISSCS